MYTIVWKVKNKYGELRYFNSPNTFTKERAYELCNYANTHFTRNGCIHEVVDLTDLMEQK